MPTTTRTTRTTRSVLAAAALAVGLLLPACSSPEAPHAGADVAFATQMVPHHTQAVAMADLALAPAPAGASDPRVRDLAQRIRAAQDPEVATMTGWLAEWGAPAPDTSGGTAGTAGMPGMMSDAEMTSLATSTGPEFDRTWVELMLAHHRGAVVMAQVEQRDGTDPEAKALAGSIAEGQSAEIEEMTGLLAQLPG
ncbi:DUF305 domain-containing protein [Rhodococcus aerolatus]